MNVFKIIPFSVELIIDDDSLLYGLKEFSKFFTQNSDSSMNFKIYKIIITDC